MTKQAERAGRERGRGQALALTAHDGVNRFLAETAYRLRCDALELSLRQHKTPEQPEFFAPAIAVVRDAATSLEKLFEGGAEEMAARRAPPPLRDHVEQILVRAVVQAQRRGLALAAYGSDVSFKGQWTARGKADLFQALLVHYQPDVVSEPWPEAHIAASRVLGILPDEVDTIMSGFGGWEDSSNSARLHDWHDLGRRVRARFSDIVADEDAEELPESRAVASSPTTITPARKRPIQRKKKKRPRAG
jgi:hypothetical protein